ncbi:MAG: methyltransferase [Ardenticatenaceae bacterium]|nr:methyltransferase [Ardenticatenaceae bacterium]
MSKLEHKIPPKYLFEGQFQHLILLACLLPGAIYLADPTLGDGSFWGIADRTWFFGGLAVVVLHQIIGWFVFRFQLVYALFTRFFGERDLLVWGIIFLPFLIFRPLFTIVVGLSDFGSIGNYRWLQIILGIFLLIPAVYTGWSIERYFGVKRALGADHFREEYGKMPLVRKGAFKYSSNAMYTYAFLLMWAIALLTGSRAALALALFQHAYIWVHMYCTEAPDMRLIYGAQGSS